jgi:hypothetical protein
MFESARQWKMKEEEVGTKEGSWEDQEKAGKAEGFSLHF